MILTDILDKANKLTLNRFKIGMKIAYSFVVVDILMLIVGYLGLYGDSISSFIDPKQMLILFIMFAIVSSIFMCIGLTRSITKPVAAMLLISNKVAKGDLTVNLKSTSNDEIGQLFTAIGTMTENLKGVIGKVQDSAIVVASTASELSASSEKMKASTEQVYNTAQEIAKGVSQQASKTTEMSSTMREMSESVKQVAANCHKASESAGNANKIAQEVVSKISNEIAQKMIEIKSTVDDSAVVIKDLDIKSQKIGEIISVITAIADQTNLLALNAAIEAARAGEHGRGFAVVADEVRKLAEESRKSATQIIALIKEIQQGTKQAVESMEKGTKTVDEGTKAFGNSTFAINSIVKASGEVAEMVQGIATAAEEQAASIEMVAVSVEEVSAISEESAAGTLEASAAAEEQVVSVDKQLRAIQELVKLAEELQAEVAKFNLGTVSSATKF